MSRRRGEFEHRTSIFEGAFRAWSHLGGLEPHDLENKASPDLDPLTHHLEFDPRMEAALKDDKYVSDSIDRRIYPYEPLPRAGLTHPYVQNAILSPWLGPDADNDAIELGLTTLRTWWQHRRKGESGSAVSALGTEKMRSVVDGYTRHFFNLAHCLVMNDKEQPPRSLHTKLKEVEKIRNKQNKKRARGEDVPFGLTSSGGASLVTSTAPDFDVPACSVPSNPSVMTNEHRSSLERLHAAQQRQLAENGGLAGGLTPPISPQIPAINMKGRCVPGKLDLPGVVNAVNHHATQLAHRGGAMSYPVTLSDPSSVAVAGEYGDSNTTPVVFVSENGDIQIAMSVDGITCAHCVKIVETVLKGCNGSKSPIDGLLDAAADRALNRILIKIDQSGKAKRIAFESARNLAMVGYSAKVKEMSIVNVGGDKKAKMDLGALSTAFEVVANTDPKDVFDWSIPCTCPDDGILRTDCARHSQMNTRIFEAFDTREEQVTEYMAGCGKKYGMPCTCGPDCRCKNCDEHCAKKQKQAQAGQPTAAEAAGTGMDQLQPLPINGHDGQFLGSARRNSSIISLGTMRQMSLVSETMPYGRAMSGLSALSIDWENMPDFDVNIDYSANINNQSQAVGASQVPTDGIAQGCAMMTGGECNCGPNCLCDGCPIHGNSEAEQRSANVRGSLVAVDAE